MNLDKNSKLILRSSEHKISQKTTFAEHLAKKHACKKKKKADLTF